MSIYSTLAISVGIKSLSVRDVLAHRQFRALLDLDLFDNYQVTEDEGKRVLEVYKGAKPADSRHLITVAEEGVLFLHREYDCHADKRDLIADLQAIAGALSAFELAPADVSYLDVREEFGDPEATDEALAHFRSTLIGPRLSSSIPVDRKSSAEIDLRIPLPEGYFHAVRIRFRSDEDGKGWSWFSGYAAIEPTHWLGRDISKTLAELVKSYFGTSIHRDNVALYSTLSAPAQAGTGEKP